MRSRYMVFLLTVIVLFFWGCDYARMSEQESIRPYERSFPEMPEGTIPISGGLNIVREMDADEMTNPLPYNRISVELGQKGYDYYCVMCHGPNADGIGTVGQSFSPLPTNLKDPDVQDQSDGDLFYTISFGMDRMPPLAYTVPEADRWAIIHYLRSLVKDSDGRKLADK